MVLQYVADYVYQVNDIYHHQTKISKQASLISSLPNHMLTGDQDRHHWNNLQIHECNQNNSRQTSCNTNLSSWYFLSGAIYVYQGCLEGLLCLVILLTCCGTQMSKYSVDTCLQILPKVSANA